MLMRSIIVWAALAGLLGFSLGGSLVWSLQETKLANHGYETIFDHMPEWFVAVFTGLLTVVTFLLVRSTNRLWKAGERQLGLARDTAQRQLRAYPGITGATIDLIESQIHIAVVIRNFSTTPAYNFKHAISHQLCEPGPITGFKKTTHKDMQWDMAPRSTTTLRSSEHVGEKTIFALRMGDLALIFWGRVDYDDAFGAHRFIEFMYRNGRFGERIIEVRGLGGLKEERIIPHCSEPEPIRYESN
jgi:hypothetical protein